MSELLQVLLITIISSITVSLLCCFTLVIFIKIKDSKEKNKLLELSRYEVNTRTQDLNMSDILDKFIAECLTDYTVMILAPRNEIYISDEREQEILSDLTAKVAERISPNLIERLSLYYNINSIDKVIADKISIAVTSYIISRNAPIDVPIKPNK